MWVVGIDENGLGPLLGPLVCTAVCVEVGAYDAERLRALGARLGLGDSKQTAGTGRMRRAESFALAWIERVTGTLPVDVDGLFGALSLGRVDGLRARCPSASVAKQCWIESIALPVFGGDLAEGRAWIDALEEGGVVPRRARTVLACVGHLNEELREGRNKLRVDLRAFEDLLLDGSRAGAASKQGSDSPTKGVADAETTVAICGKVGGIMRYGQYFERLSAERVAVLGEDRQASLYRWQAPFVETGVGSPTQEGSPRGTLEVRFEVKADDRHLPVGLASMIGKYVRELWMARQARFYQRHDSALDAVSGYHDPKTQRFVKESEALRERLGIVDACFRREG